MQLRTESVCARPECGNPLNKGKLYCSSACAAMDRPRVRKLETAMRALSTDARELVPRGLVQTLHSALGDGAIPVLEEIAVTLAEQRITPSPLLKTNITDSGEQGTYGAMPLLRGDGGVKVYRPHDALDYDVIEDMLRCGQVLFAVMMKTAYIRSVLRNPRSWAVECKDRRMADVVKGIMTRVFNRNGQDIVQHMPYGAAFFEKEFDLQPAEFWGIDKVRGDFYGYRNLKAVHPRSVECILYTSGERSFNGYIQKKSAGNKVTVPPELALILTYNKKWRNLWGNPSLDPTYPYWFWYEIALRSFLRYLERTGTPVVVARAPSRGTLVTPDGTKTENMKYALLVAGYAAKSNAIALPSDTDSDTGQKLWELDYLTDDKRGDQFVRAVELLGTLIIRSQIIGERAISQGSDVGSYAAAQVHMNASMVHNELVLDELIGQVNDYLVAPLVQYNGTSQTPAANIVTEGLDQEEKNRLFQLLNTMGNQPGGNTLRLIDWRKILDVENIPTLSDEDVNKAFEEELRRTARQGAVDSGGELPPETVIAGAFPKRPKPKQPVVAQPQVPVEGQPEQPVQQSVQQPVQQSMEYMLWQVSNGAQVPLLLTDEQANELVERCSPK